MDSVHPFRYNLDWRSYRKRKADPTVSTTDGDIAGFPTTHPDASSARLEKTQEKYGVKEHNTRSRTGAHASAPAVLDNDKGQGTSHKKGSSLLPKKLQEKMPTSIEEKLPDKIHDTTGKKQQQQQQQQQQQEPQQEQQPQEPLQKSMTTSVLDSGTKQKEARHDSKTSSVLDDINSEYDAKPAGGRAGGKSEFHDSGIDIANEKPPEHEPGTASKDGYLDTHAQENGDASVVPKPLQKVVPERVERALPNSVHDTGDVGGIHRNYDNHLAPQA